MSIAGLLDRLVEHTICRLRGHDLRVGGPSPALPIIYCPRCGWSSWPVVA